MSCPDCNDTQQVKRYISNGYDKPLTTVVTACPKCCRPSSSFLRDLKKPQPPFPQAPDKNRN